MKNNLVTAEKKRKYPMHLLMEAVTYRSPLPVTKVIVYTSNDSYPLCPRCSISLDREYMYFCDRCGQKLNWDLFEYAKVIRPDYRRK